MEFAAYGDKNSRAIIFVHGSCTTAETCYSKLAETMKNDFYCILCKLDGHYDGSEDFISLTAEAEQIEKYIGDGFGGHVYALIGLSLGSTICVRMLERNRISAEKVILDGACVQNKGRFYADMSAFMCNIGISYIRRGGSIPDKLVEMVFGKGNTSVVSMMYEGSSKATVKNVCKQVYCYKIGSGLSDCGSSVVCIRGEFEPIPKESFRLLSEHLKNIREIIIPNCGHVQYLNEQPQKYLDMLNELLA